MLGKVFGPVITNLSLVLPAECLSLASKAGGHESESIIVFHKIGTFHKKAGDENERALIR